MNDFLTLEPVVASGRFVGRAEDIEALAAMLGGRTPQNCNLVGEPKIGRTSLLRQIYEQKSGAAHPERSVFVWVALTKLPERTSVAFWDQLWEAFRTQLAATSSLSFPAGMPAGPGIGDDVDRVGALFRSVEAALKAYEREVEPADRRIVFVVDDFDLIMPYLEAGDLDRLRALITTFLDWFAFVMSSSEPLIEVKNRYDKFRTVNSQLFDVFQHLQLALLTRRDAEQWVVAAAKDEGLSYSAGDLRADIDFLCAEVGRHPLLLKLGCRQLFAARKTGAGHSDASNIFFDDLRFDIRDDSHVKSLCETAYARHFDPQSACRLLEILAQDGIGQTQDRGWLRRLERVGILERREQKLAFFADAFADFVTARASRQQREPAKVANDKKWVYSPEKRVVTVEGVEHELSSLEYRLLDYLYANANRVCTFEEIRGNVWGSAKTKSVVEKGINRLRAKVEPDPSRPHFVLSYKGEGYMLRVPQG